MRSDRPCRLAPELWFGDRSEQGQAIHWCLRHCSRLEVCAATEERPVDGVLAGVPYTAAGVPSKKPPPEVRCGGCIAFEPNRFQKPRAESRWEDCGTTTASRRHVKRGERPCHPCAVAYNRQRAEYRRRRAA